MLTDMLGIIVAFIAVIALLSVLVTSLVQMTQAVLRLRSRNLKVGIEKLLMTWREVARRESEVPDKEAARQASRDAAAILNAPNLAPIGRAGDPNSWLRWLIGPRVSWIAPEDLPEAIRREEVDVPDPTGNTARQGAEPQGQAAENGHPDPTGAGTRPRPDGLSDERIRQDFERLSPALQKRFLRSMRLWGLAWALIVAVAFQVSAPELLSALATAAERRENLQSGVDDTLASEQPGDALGQAEQTAQRLASFGIELWPGGWEYYYRGQLRVDAIVGVLITAILLSLGAPFWFEQLRNSIRFRDLLAGKAQNTNDTPNPNTNDAPEQNADG